MSEKSPAWFQALGYLFLAVCILLVVYSLYRAYRYRRFRYDALYHAVGLLWGVGLACKVAGFGPDLLRFWLADVGFPLLIGWTLWEVIRGRAHKRARRSITTHTQSLVLACRYVAERKRLLLVAVVAPVLAEGRWLMTWPVSRPAPSERRIPCCSASA